ncbi:MAG: hypothetical protein Kow00122_06170 [Thermoleophilia bacterium]
MNVSVNVNQAHGPDVTDYRIAPGVLEAIVRGALAGETRVRLHGGAMKRSHGVDVRVDGSTCRVALQLEALFGADLVETGCSLQRRVAERLGRITGLEVEAVDITFAGVYPAEPVG